MSDFSRLSLKGKTAIVTGSSKGIGAGSAILLAKRGANVVVNFIASTSADRAEQTAASVRAAGPKAVVVQADVSDVSKHQKLVDAALELSDNGRIDIPIHK